MLNHNSSLFVNDKHLTILADRFLHKKFALNPINLPAGDYADYKGWQYIYFGPMPSLVLMPFTFLFGLNFSQYYLSIASIIILFLSTYCISIKFIQSKSDSLMLANFFVFGTVFYFTSLINISSLVVQTFGVALVTLSIVEYFSKRRWILIGLLVAAAAMTRFSLLASGLFFILMGIHDRVGIKKLSHLILPIVAAMLLLFLYNERRFNSFIESGYSYQTMTNTYPMSSNIKFGLFSYRHIAANVYNLFLRGPDPLLEPGGGFVMKFPYLKANGWGLAIWFTSPLFLYLLKLKRNQYTFPVFVTVGILMLPSLFYFGIGYVQFGYRYSLDFLPFLFLILLPIFKNGLTSFAKLLIVMGIIFNGLYMFSIWDNYPVFDFFQHFIL